MDPLVIVDGRHYLHRYHLDQSRATLAIDIARCLELAQRRGQSGIQEQLSVFFKLPMSAGTPVHAFHEQEAMLLSWLAS